MLFGSGKTWEGTWGGASGLYKVARCYRGGIGVEKDLKMAMKYYFEAQQRNHPDATFDIVDLYLECEADIFAAFDFKNIYEHFKKYTGDKHHFYLGQCYLNGIGVMVNTVAALEHFKESANLGNYSAAYAAGYFYEMGYGIDGNLETRQKAAFGFYSQAAESQNLTYILNKARCYEKGIGTKPCPNLESDCYLQAIEKGSIEAEYKLGMLYLDKRILHPTPKILQHQAFLHLKNAGAKGHREALYQEAICYEYGMGTKQDLMKALSCYEQAAEKGHLNAAIAMKWHYANNTALDLNDPAILGKKQQYYPEFGNTIIGRYPGSDTLFVRRSPPIVPVSSSSIVSPLSQAPVVFSPPPMPVVFSPAPVSGVFSPIPAPVIFNPVPMSHSVATSAFVIANTSSQSNGMKKKQSSDNGSTPKKQKTNSPH